MLALNLLATAACLLVPAMASAQEETEPPPPAPPPAVEPPMTAPAPEAEAPREAAVAPAPCPVDGTERTLKDHVFLFPAYAASSIVATYVGLRVRLGENIANSTPTAIGTSDIEATTLSEGLDVGIKFTDWLGIFVTGGVRALIGTNLRALTYAGATYDLGASGGPIVRIFRSERTGSQLSVRGYGSYTSGQVSTLFPLFDQPIASIVDLLQGDLGSSIKTPFKTVSYGGAFAFTQGISRLFGIQASAGAGGSTVTLEPYNRATKTRDSATVSEVTYSFGIAPSVDFNAFHVPIAVMPEYVFARQASSAQVRGSGDFDTLHTIAVGAYYSGRVNLQVGLIWATQLSTAPLITPQGSSDTPTVNNGELILRYVW